MLNCFCIIVHYSYDTLWPCACWKLQHNWIHVKMAYGKYVSHVNANGLFQAGFEGIDIRGEVDHIQILGGKDEG